jgi:homeobox protein ESX1
MKEAARAQQEALRGRAEAGRARSQEQQQPSRNMQAWGEHLDRWERSEEMQKWQRDMEKWGALMEQWGHDLARRQAEARDGSEAQDIAPMPALPPMPPLPPAPAEMAVPPAVPHVSPHPGSSGVPHITVPRIRPPRVAVPRIDPPAPPAVPEKRANEQEAVSRTEHEIDLAPGRLLDVQNALGSLTVRGGEGPGARLVVTVKGRAETMEEAQAIVDQAKLLIQPSEKGVSVSISKPEKEDRERIHRVVTMELVVPRDAQLRLSQNFGDIRLTDLKGSIRAVSNMGSIRAAEVRGRVDLESNMGSIDFLAPQDFSAKVQTKVQMGSIQSDLPLEFAKSDAFSMGDKASGTIGGGEGDLSLTTNMGSIRIRSESSEPARVRASRREPRPQPQPEPEPREVF